MCISRCQFLVFALISVCIACAVTKHEFPDGKTSIVAVAVHSEPLHTKGVLSQSVQDVFSCLGQEVTTLQDANAFAQAHFLRRGERWDQQDTASLQLKMIEQKPFIVERLRAIGMIDETTPQYKKYTYALLLGATTQVLTERLLYLKTLCDTGYEFAHIALLGGVRLLQDEEKVGLPDNIQTEAEMMEYVYAQAGFDESKKLLINSQMIQKEDGTLTRPTTDTTFVDFIQAAPQGGSCLVISNSPFTLRQRKVAERILDATEFPVDAAGANVDVTKYPREAVVILMDEFARTLYEDWLKYKKDAGI
jgi:hypothetical protein